MEKNPQFAEDKVCLFTLVGGLRVIWEITNKCGYNCKHCCSDAKNISQKELDTQEVKLGLDRLISQGAESIYFSGGEPLARNDFFELFQYASLKLKPQNINFATNGKLIDRNLARRISNELSPGTVLVSLDGHDEETSEQFRGVKKSFRYAIKAMENLANENVNTRMGVVIWKGNYLNLEDFVKIGIERRVNSVFFNWLVPAGRAEYNHQDICVGGDRFFPTAHEINRLQEKYGEYVDIGYHRFEKIDDNCKGCQAGKGIIHISPTGEISPCSWIYKLDRTFLSNSSIAKENLPTIFKEPSFVRLRRIMEGRDEQKKGPGCIAMCKAFGGDFMQYDPLYIKGGKFLNENR